MVGANGETALCAVTGGNLLLLTSKLIMPKTCSCRPTRGWQRRVQERERRKQYYEWARVELSCRQPEGFSRWFLLPPLS